MKIEIDGAVLIETDAAILFSPTGDEEDAGWLPLSQIDMTSGDVDPTVFYIGTPEWLAKEKGLL